MRPEPDDTRAVELLLEELPEVEPTYLELVRHFDEDCTTQVVFTAVAEAIEALLARPGDHEETLESFFAAIEVVAAAGDVDATEAVGYCVLDVLSPEALRRALAYLGPMTERLLERLEAGELELG